MRWTWDEAKDRANRLKHKLSFETAALVFDDPMAASRLDGHTGEERWQTVGMIGYTCVLVVHALPVSWGGDEVGRIVSARRATPHERKDYEEGDF